MTARPHHPGNLLPSMRANYAQHGVEGYYNKVAASYANPHYEGVRRCLWEWLCVWWARERDGEGTGAVEGDEEGRRAEREVRVVDLAAGSGEVTTVLLEWWRSGVRRYELERAGDPSTSSLAQAPVPMRPASSAGESRRIQAADPLAVLRAGRAPLALPNERPAVVRPTPAGANARPPVARRIRDPTARTATTTATKEPPADHPSTSRLSPAPPISPTARLRLIATDPYTAPAYEKRTSLRCELISFRDVAEGRLPAVPRESVDGGGDGPAEWEGDSAYDLTICSFALHLVPPSELFSVLWALSERTRWLVVLAPHKRPEIKPSHGFVRYDLSTWSPLSDADSASAKASADGADGEDGDGASDGDVDAEGRSSSSSSSPLPPLPPPMSGAEIVRERVRLRVYRSVNAVD